MLSGGLLRFFFQGKKEKMGVIQSKERDLSALV